LKKSILVLLAAAPILVAAACKKSEAPVPGTASEKSAPPAAASGAAGDGLVTDKALVDGHLAEIRHSKWDGGQSSDLFDEDPKTLARTEKANPAIVEVLLPNPRPLKGVSITTGGMDVGLTVVVKPQGAAPKTYTKEFRQMKPDPTFGLDFDTGTAPIESVRVEIKDLNGGDGHIHIRTLKLL
jgi:hypothetical protein